jgi:hypothetical protein
MFLSCGEMRLVTDHGHALKWYPARRFEIGLYLRSGHIVLFYRRLTGRLTPPSALRRGLTNLDAFKDKQDGTYGRRNL